MKAMTTPSDFYRMEDLVYDLQILIGNHYLMHPRDQLNVAIALQVMLKHAGIKPKTYERDFDLIPSLPNIIEMKLQRRCHGDPGDEMPS